MKFVKDLKRSHYAGDLNKAHVGQTVTVMGWVNTRRDHGSLVFVDLRDRTGLLQVVIDPKIESNSTIKEIRSEYVLALQGVVRARPEGMINSKLSSGEVEVEVQRCEVLNPSAVPPFQIDDENVSENLRLKYRYLDLRSLRMQKNLLVRHKVAQAVRQYLSDQGFLEIETPILYKSTPEGARDYLVPSRVNLGQFYALPQSPQTLKQLLMVSGYDRYFQIARCFRDEDLRADRQPEFSQIDMEMSFIDQEDIMAVNEGLLRNIWKFVKNVNVGEIPRLTYQQAMDWYGNDKPDIRFEMKIKDLKEVATGSGFRVFEDALARKGIVRGITVPGGSKFSRGQLDKLTEISKRADAKGLIWIKKETDGTYNSPVSKAISQEKIGQLFTLAQAKPEDCVLIVADDFAPACAALSTLRNHLGKELGLIDTTADKFLWVVDFPCFEYSVEEARWVACHHPFTAPKDEYTEDLVSGNEAVNGKMLAKAYDLVCNGYEIAGGSIRIHRSEVQSAMFKALGLTEADTQNKFGYFIDALKYGTPPHGGIAWGMDRLAMILCNTDAIREVIAFPKTAKASCLMSDSPSTVNRDQLAELGVKLSPLAEKHLESLDQK